MQQVIDTTDDAAFGDTAAAIEAWEKALVELNALQGEADRIRTEISKVSQEESEILGDSELAETQAAKRLTEARSRKEVRLARLQTALNKLGLQPAGVKMPPHELKKLEAEVEQLRIEIRALQKEEASVFGGASVSDVQGGRRLADIRPRIEVKQARLRAIADKLASQPRGIRAEVIVAGEEVTRQLGALVEQLIQKR